MPEKSTRPQPSFTQTSEGNYLYLRYIHRFAELASTFNWGALMFVLGSYGLVLSNPLFWVCWSILVIKAVIYNFMKPYWEWIESEGSRDDHGRARAIIFKLGMCIALIALLLYSQDITQRQYTILFIVAASIILFEGLTPLLTRIEEFNSRRSSLGYITGVQKYKALIFSAPSALNAMISMTGPIVLGGELGQLMRKEAFWVFTFMFLVDGLAEVFPGIVSGRRSPFVRSEDLPRTDRVVIILRVIVEACLCCWLGEVIGKDSYFPSDLGMDECNKLCRERSRHLLITMVALGGLQAAATFITSLGCVLGRQNVPTIPLFVHSHFAS